MTTTERDRANAYKVGFMKKLAEIGALPSEFFKAASGLSALALANMATGAMGSGASLAGEAGKMGIQAALAAPLLAGTATGAAEGLLDAPSQEDIELLRKKELLELYKRLTEEVNLRKSMHEAGQFKRY